MANLKSNGAIPADLIATLTNLPRLRAQLRDISQDVAIGIPEAVTEALNLAQEALDLAELTKGQPFLLAAAAPALPASRVLTVEDGMSILDDGETFEISLHQFLVSLSLLSGNGIVAKTVAGAQLRAIEAGSARIEVMNGDGTTGNPAIDIDEPSLNLANMGGTLGISHGGTGVTVLAAFSAHNNGVAQAIPSAAFTVASMSTELFDLGSAFAANAWTPPAGRPISIMGAIGITLVATAPSVMTSIFKNGVEFKRGQQMAAAPGIAVIVAHCIDVPSGTDVYTLRVYQDSGASQNTIGSAATTYFMGSML